MNRAAMNMLKNGVYGAGAGAYAATSTRYGSYFRLPLLRDAHEMLLVMYSELFEHRDGDIYFKGTLGKYTTTPIEIMCTRHPLVAEILNGSNQSRMFLRLDQHKGIYFITRKFWEGFFFNILRANGINKLIKKYNIELQYGDDDVKLDEISDQNLEAVIRNYKIKNIIDSE